MSKSNTFENDLVKLIFNGTPIPNIADNAGSGPLAVLYLGLHTADPGEAGDQETSECAYTSYDRVAVDRDNTGFTISNNEAALAADQDFPECTGGSEEATHFTVGTAASGAGKMLYRGALSPSIVISAGVIPRLKAGTKCTED